MGLDLSMFGMKSRSILGLDIGSHAVKAVELANVSMDKGFELAKLGVSALEPESIVQGAFLNTSAIVDGIRRAVEAADTKTKDVAVAVSGHSVIVKKISLPSMSQEELEESIRWEAEQYIPFDVNEVFLDFQILDRTAAEGQMDVLLVAAKKDLINDYLQVITEAGLNPVVMDVAAFAVSNAFELNYEKEADEVVAIVNVGSQVVNINILVRGVPTFTRDIATGGMQYTEEIQKALAVSQEDAERIKIGGKRTESSQEVVPQEVERAIRSVTDVVLGEITRSLDFFSATAADSRINKIYLAGGSSRIAGFDRAFQDRANVPVEYLNPLQRMLPNSQFDPDYLEQIGPSLAVGIGLAMRRFGDR